MSCLVVQTVMDSDYAGKGWAQIKEDSLKLEGNIDSRGDNYDSSDSE